MAFSAKLKGDGEQGEEAAVEGLTLRLLHDPLGNKAPCFHSRSLLGGERKKVKVAQSCLTLGNPTDYRVHGILQARILECVASPFRDPPNPGIEARSPALQADSLPAEPQGKP